MNNAVGQKTPAAGIYELITPMQRYSLTPTG